MLKFENPSNGRFYYMFMMRDLFNDLNLCIFYGGRHSRFIRTIGYNCRNTIREEMERLSKRRLKRGYLLVK